MQPVADYRLATPVGDDTQRPLRTPLLHADGRPVGCSIPGCVLLHQFRVGTDCLLITDWDCPYEEVTEVLLLDAAHRPVGHRRLGGLYASWCLRRVDVVDARRLRLAFYGDDAAWQITVRPPGRWWSPSGWRSRLAVERLRR